MEHAVPVPDLAGLVAEAWLAVAVDADNPLLAGTLQARFAHVDVTTLTITLPALATATEAGEPAWGVHRITAEPVDEAARSRVLGYRELADGSLAALDGAVARLVVTEALPGLVDPTRRVAAFLDTVGALDEVIHPLAWSFRSAATVVAGEPDETSLGGLLVLDVAPSDARPDGWLMQTFGMEPLGLPDVECHLHGLPTQPVGERMLDLARGMVADEFIGDGDPVIVGRADVDGYEHWFTARYEMSTAEPHRRVIALVPDPEHAINPPPEQLELDEDA